MVGEQVKKVKCKLWGKCRAGSVNTANFRIVAGVAAPCEGISEVAGEVVDIVKRVLHKNEGEFGTFSDLKAKFLTMRDNIPKPFIFSPHHIPSNSFMDNLKKRFPNNPEIQKYNRDDGFAIQLEAIYRESRGGLSRHSRTDTYFTTKPQSYLDDDPNSILKREVNDLIKIFKQDDVYNYKIKAELQKLVNETATKYPSIFTKYTIN